MKVVYPPPFSRISNVFADHAFNVVYPNTSGKIMMVLINFLHSVTVAGGAAYTIGKIDASDPPTTIRGRAGLNAAPIMAAYGTLVLFVPVGENYKIESFENNGTNTTNVWLEMV